MEIKEPMITFRNLINTIDVTVLKLKRVKKGEEFSNVLKTQIINILNFIIESKTESFTDALFNKGVFIEKETLEMFHNNLMNLHFTKDELKKLTLNIDEWNEYNVNEINEIQSVLMKISIPIWKTTQELTYV